MNVKYFLLVLLKLNKHSEIKQRFKSWEFNGREISWFASISF